ncbi:hypothetical protein L798_03802 [Zootermopsis nevadensis]|uniref:Uncharacterized protein n=1 Tax=Zootermopsis nevadensis TaxID=136037 RepID=A0A067RD57_ZOONE|nr:hypothetical protein L798_03802 [Zootermopsis nevadensis]
MYMNIGKSPLKNNLYTATVTKLKLKSLGALYVGNIPGHSRNNESVLKCSGPELLKGKKVRDFESAVLKQVTRTSDEPFTIHHMNAEAQHKLTSIHCDTKMN